MKPTSDNFTPKVPAIDKPTKRTVDRPGPKPLLQHPPKEASK